MGRMSDVKIGENKIQKTGGEWKIDSTVRKGNWTAIVH